MTKLRLKFDSAEDPTRPEILKSAYTEIADAFQALGDEEEVAKWRSKAAKQAALAFDAENLESSQSEP